MSRSKARSPRRHRVARRQPVPPRAGRQSPRTGERSPARYEAWPGSRRRASRRGICAPCRSPSSHRNPARISRDITAPESWFTVDLRLRFRGRILSSLPHPGFRGCRRSCPPSNFRVERRSRPARGVRDAAALRSARPTSQATVPVDDGRDVCRCGATGLGRRHAISRHRVGGFEERPAGSRAIARRLLEREFSRPV